MAHFAELDHENIVKRVIVVVNDIIVDSDGNDDEQKGIDFLQSIYGGWWKQTSYSGTFRKNFAGAGMKYNGIKDAFIAPKPYPSWLLDEDTCRWGPPVVRPDLPTNGKTNEWDEDTTSWKEIE
jgi:hypothetical protein